MRTLLFWILLWGALAGSVLAESPVLTLKECEKLALSRYPALKAALFQKEAAQAREKAAFREHLPKLYGTYEYRAYRDPELIKTPFGAYPLRDREEALLAITVRLPVFHGLAISTRQALAKLRVRLSAVEEARLRQEILLKVREAYFGLVEAEKEVELARKSLARRRAHLKDVRGFLRQGLVARNQLLEAEAQVEEARYRVAAAESRLAVARARLNLLLQRPLSAPLKVVPEFPQRPLKASCENLVKSAFEHRPEVRAAELAIRMREKEVRLARSRYFPWLDLEAQYYKRGDTFALSENPYGDRENAWVGLSLNWEIWDWGLRGQEVAAARAELAAQKFLLQEVKDQVALEVKEAYLQLRAARRQVEAARKGVAAARENFRLVRARFREGLSDTTEVMDAETLLLQAETHEVSALSAYEIARARLAHAVGLPDLP
ncbi:TolC family protein [Thermosulfurimonas marina]|uniref:TolC family protein n=1 Tax=Thermosulfurimonas marina TaxID=2047767 RepID=A0A6H1WS66_9BACT|nr:TolC family protein [Thermosulfurimonas marina]QJA05999.1 TolC family protein [Thermosulfurimonas marina]